MAQKTRTALAAQVGTLIADNTTQNITPGDVRTCLGDLADSVGLYQQIIRTDLQSRIAGSTIETNSLYQLTDAVTSKSIVVFGLSSSAISALAFNLTDNTFGNYNITADTFTVITGATGPTGATGASGATGPAGTNGTNGTNGQGVPTGGTTGQVLVKNSSTNFDTSWVTPAGGTGAPEFITTKVSLTAAQLATLNSAPVSIPAFPAPGAGNCWQPILFSMKYTFVTTDYNFADIDIIGAGCINIQLAILMSGGWLGTDLTLIGAPPFSNPTSNDSFTENVGLQIFTSTDDSAGGDGTAVVYITAQKIAL